MEEVDTFIHCVGGHIKIYSLFTGKSDNAKSKMYMAFTGAISHLESYTKEKNNQVHTNLYDEDIQCSIVYKSEKTKLILNMYY